MKAHKLKKKKHKKKYNSRKGYLVNKKILYM